jgi:hypothetical protein
VDVYELNALVLSFLIPDGAQGVAGEEERMSNFIDANGKRWTLALCPDAADAAGYLLAFERGMQALIEAAASDASHQLGMALAFGSTECRQPISYRRALKKYSNSIVFEDLGIHLLLARSEKRVMMLPPEEVTAFLQGLDRWIVGEGV